MDLAGWDQRYRTEADSATAPESSPTPLLRDTASHLPPGRALDLACGTGRNALWLAQHGWNVTAVDGSPAAIETLLRRAQRLGVAVDARVADLETSGFAIEPSIWDLIATCYYLQRDLIQSAKRGLAPGGVMVAIALLVEPGRENSPYRVQPGELRRYFDGWEILHDREGPDASRHAVAEIVSRRPNSDTIEVMLA
jgi:tellurite methyltransferase